jgi:hypothetical protein
VVLGYAVGPDTVERWILVVVYLRITGVLKVASAAVKA